MVIGHQLGKPVESQENMCLFGDPDTVKQNITAVESEVRCLEDTIASMEETISQLRYRHLERLCTLQALRQAALPVRRIPFELVTEIFQWLFLLHQQEGRNSTQISIPWQAGKRPWQLDLLHTCSTWRQIAQKSDFLWRNIMVVVPRSRFELDEDDTSEDEYEDWSGEDEWISRINAAFKIMAPTGPVVVGIDMEWANWDYQRACQLAVTHLYDPLFESGRSVSIAIRGYYAQIEYMFEMKLKYPGLLEHLILRDMGTPNSSAMKLVLEEFFDPESSAEFFEAASNFHKLDLIAESERSVLLDENMFDHLLLPWERFTHLRIDHPFRTTGRNAILSSTLYMPRGCQNLTHLTLVVGLPDQEDPNEWVLEAQEYLELPFLKTLIIAFDMNQIFRHFKVPSLVHLEIRNKGGHPLEHVIDLIDQSGCSLTTFIEVDPDEPLEDDDDEDGFFGCIPLKRKTTYPIFNNLLEFMDEVVTFETLTILDLEDLKSIASGELLPSVAHLQFYTSVPLDCVFTTLRPRLKFNSSDSYAFTHLDDVIVKYIEPTHFSYEMYMDGTYVTVRAFNNGSRNLRTKF